MEKLQSLIQKYPPSGNCLLTRAPNLNPEIKSAMGSASIKKDYYQTVHQNQLAAAINALGIALTEALNRANEEPNSQFIELLSDSGRILADLQHSLSITRRGYILPALNPLVKNIADGSSVDSLLFREDFPERLKAAEAVERSSKTVAKTVTNSKY